MMSEAGEQKREMEYTLHAIQSPCEESMRGKGEKKRDDRRSMSWGKIERAD